jgi:hypothetical protein
MTKDEALKMAIKALLTGHHHIDLCNEAINACKEALEQPAQEQPAQEPVACHCGNPAFNLQSITHTKTKCFQHSLQNPVAWTDEYEMFLEWDKEILCDKAVCKEHEAIPLYTHPHQWQGLTDDVINNLWNTSYVNGCLSFEHRLFFARAIEQASKEKNT